MRAAGWRKRVFMCMCVRECEKLCSITRVGNVIYQKSMVKNEHPNRATKTGEAIACATLVQFKSATGCCHSTQN